MDKALILKNVSFRKGCRQIFTDINLEVGRGETIAITGAPSSNLSEFEDLLIGNRDAKNSFSGSVILDAAEIEKLSQEAFRFLRMVNIGVLPLNASIGNLKMSVQSYITLPFCESIKKTEREIILDAKRIMELLGVHDTEAIMRKKMNRLSQDDLRAVLYAAALSTDPCVALCYADVKMAEEEKNSFFTLLIKICKIKNIALILLTSDLSFAKEYGEKVYFLNQDKILPYESSFDTEFLEQAAILHPLPKNELNAEDTIRVSHMKVKGHDDKLDFTLYKKEVVSLSLKNGALLFSGKKKPARGNIYADNVALPRNKSFQKSILHVSAAFPIIPAEKIKDLLSAFSKRPSLKDDMGRILDHLPLPLHFTEKPCKPNVLFETLYIGLLCAAMSEAKLILLSDIDSLTNNVEKYELLALLFAICDRTGAGAVVFTEDDAVHRIISSKLNPKIKNESTNERTDAYADAT